MSNVLLRRFAAVVLLALVAPPASAQIDVTGRWKVTFRYDRVGVVGDESISLVQTGTTLTVLPPVRYTGGTVDPVTGVLHLDGPAGCTGSVPSIIDAVAEPDGASLAGSFQDSVRQLFNCLIVSGTVTAVRLPDACGNGVVDDGEACDGGTTGSACCTAFCTPRPAGTTCFQANPVCQATAFCDGANTCVRTQKAAGVTCRAKENPCDTAEVCDGIALDCPPPSSPTEPDVDGDGVLDGCDGCVGAPLENVKLKLGRFGVGATQDMLSLKARVRFPAPIVLPAQHGKAVELRDATGAQIVDEQIPAPSIAGSYEWQQKAGGWLLENPEQEGTQVTYMMMKPSRRDPTLWDVKVRMPRATLPDAAGTPPLALEINLNTFAGTSKQCGRLVFGPPRSSPPSCSAPNGSGVISCR